jgi:NAD(P)-dependent dehydrogenase (short-subunit alcohol dehydrogenase family)
VLRINLSGVMFGTRAVLPHMLAQGRGAIINTASAAGIRGGFAGAAYTAAKHGVVGLTRNVAWTYGKRGIRCNAICPAAVATNVDGGLGFAAFDQAGFALLQPALALGTRVADPDNMATVASFLASDAAAFVNGAILPVDDGVAAA